MYDFNNIGEVDNFDWIAESDSPRPQPDDHVHTVDYQNGEIVVSTKGYWAEGKKLIANVDKVIDKEKGGVKITVKLTNP